MAGTFELFADADSRIRFRLVAPNGCVLAVSGQYPDKYQAAAAIKDVRECAGTGLIQDLTPPGSAPAVPSRSSPRMLPSANGAAGPFGAAWKPRRGLAKPAASSEQERQPSFSRVAGLSAEAGPGRCAG